MWSRMEKVITSCREEWSWKFIKNIVKIAGLGGNVSVQVAMSAYLIGIDWEYGISWENDYPRCLSIL